jgi:nitroreductase
VKVWRAIATQRAVREFKRKPIEPKRLERIVDAGRLAPSSNNDQRWRFIVVTDPARLAQLSKVGAWAQHVAGAPAAIALITPEATEPWEAESIAFDLGQAAQNMLLAAWEMGIGGCHAAVYYREVARDILGYPPGWRCEYLIAFGYMKRPIGPDTRRGTARRPLKELRYSERWADPTKEPPDPTKESPSAEPEADTEPEGAGDRDPEEPGYQA